MSQWEQSALKLVRTANQPVPGRPELFARVSALSRPTIAFMCECPRPLRLPSPENSMHEYQGEAGSPVPTFKILPLVLLVRGGGMVGITRGPEHVKLC